MSKPTSPKMLTVRQAADQLGYPATDAVYRLIAAGQLKALHVGLQRAKRKTYRIRQHDLDRFLNSREKR